MRLFNYDPFKDFEKRFFGVDRVSSPTATKSEIEIWANENSVFLTVELPGVEADDLAITLEDNVLTIEAEKKSPEHESALMRECQSGKYRRSVKITPNVNADDVAADLKNGVLYIELEKYQPETKKIEIAVG